MTTKKTPKCDICGRTTNGKIRLTIDAKVKFCCVQCWSEGAFSPKTRDKKDRKAVKEN